MMKLKSGDGSAHIATLLIKATVITTGIVYREQDLFTTKNPRIPGKVTPLKPPDYNPAFNPIFGKNLFGRKVCLTEKKESVF
jgi:hypothetical protein